MARRNRNRFRGITSINLGGLPDILNRSATGMDVVVGAGVGFVGSQVISSLAKKYLPPSIVTMLFDPNSIVGKLSPVIVSAAAGMALYYGQKKSSRGLGHAIGALAVGVALSAREMLRGVSVAGITFDEVVSVNLGGYGGLLVADNTGMNGYAGLLVDDNTGTKASLNQLGSLSMGGDDDGLYSLMS